MATKRRRKHRKHRARPPGSGKGVAAPTRSAKAKAAQPIDGAKSPKRATGREAPEPATAPRTGRPRLRSTLLPGQAFFALGRPLSGLVCYALQASLVGWLPAALWAASAQRRVEQKRLALAARLLPVRPVITTTP